MKYGRFIVLDNNLSQFKVAIGENLEVGIHDNGCMIDLKYGYSWTKDQLRQIDANDGNCSHLDGVISQVISELKGERDGI